MGSAASTAKANRQPQPPADSSPLFNGLDSAVCNSGTQIEARMAQERLQKVAFEGEKPGWKDSFREYSNDRGVNKAVRLEWSEDTAQPKQRSFKSTSSGNSFKGTSPNAPRSKPTTPTVTNPNVGTAAPPPNAGRSPISHHHAIVQTNGQVASLAPSALGTPTAPLEDAPSAHNGAVSHRSTTSTVYSVAVTIPSRNPDMGSAQGKSNSGSHSPPAHGGPRSPLVGNVGHRLETRSIPRRPSASSELDMEMTATSTSTVGAPFKSNVSIQSTGGGFKPAPPPGLPPRKISRGESDVDGEAMMADFSNATNIAENAAVSASSTPTGMPALNLAPVAAQAAFRNQPPPKSALGHQMKGKTHNNSSGHREGSASGVKPLTAKQLPNNVPPPGLTPSSGHRVNSRGGQPPAPITPASVNTTSGGGELKVKSFPHAVKETSDVKRNRAQIPTRLTHAKPTTGDWLKKRYIVNNYIMLDMLGTGSYGEVRLAKDRNTDKLYAVKIFSKDFLRKKKQGRSTETYEEDIRREIAIMKKLLHPNVLRLFEVLDDPNVNKMYLVLEYMKRGDLLHFLGTRDKEVPTAEAEDNKKKAKDYFPPVSERELWIIFRQVVQGVKYLHQHNIIHGDIKPHNLLMGDDGIIRIADFGISKMLEDAREKLEDATGTPAFMSPELCNGSASISGQLADVWAIGATMFMLLFGFPPFLAGSIINLYQKIINDPLVFPHAIDPSLSDLFEHMLEKVPDKRYSLEEVIRHPWLKQPPTSYIPPPADKTNASNFGVWPPADTYSKEADDAMNSPIKTADNDDLNMSILDTKTNHLADPEEEKLDEDDNLMGTNWGNDVFEQVDDDDFQSGSEDEVDDYDSDSVDSAPPKVSKRPAVPSKLEAALPDNRFNETVDIAAAVHTTGESKSSDDSVKESENKRKPLHQSNRTSSFMSREQMDDNEEKERTLRFQKKNAAKKYVVEKKANDSDSDYSDDDFQPQLKKKNVDPMFDTMLSSTTDGQDAPPSRHAAPLAHKQPGVKPVNPLSIKLQSDIGDDSDNEGYDELSMDDFNNLMDTLSNPVNNPVTTLETPTSQSPMRLSSVKVMDISRNIHNGIGSACHTEKGQRPNQEDRYVMWPNIPPWEKLVERMADAPLRGWSVEDMDTIKRFSIFGIFDGHSGSMCSEYLRQNLLPSILRNRDILGKKTGRLLLDSFGVMDEEVCNLLRQEVDSSGSTAIVAVYDGRHNTFTVANTGDSMLILSRAGRAVRMHKMHRLDDADECDRIKKAGGMIVNRRVNGLLAISRAMGDTQFKSVDGPSLVIATPDVHTEIITPMTEFALIATDGLWDVIEAQDAVNFIRKRLGKKIDVDQIAKDLVKAALDRGSVDNVTAIIVAFHINISTPDKNSTPF